MNEQLLALLRTKFDGVQDAILKRIADKFGQGLSKTSTEDDIQGIVDKVTFQDVLESYGDSRATEASRTAVNNFKKKNGIQDRQEPEQPQDQDDDFPSDAPKWAQNLIQQNQELSKKLEGLEKQEKRKTLIEKVHEKLSKGNKKVPSSFWKNRPIQVESEKDIDSVVSQIHEDFAAVRKELLAEGLSDDPKVSLGGSASQVEKDIEKWASKE